jgi:hypothetical protein
MVGMPLRLLLSSLVLTALAVTTPLLLRPASDSSASSAALAAQVPEPVHVLAAWDRRRARAWARADAAELRRLYLPGSSVGRRDVRILEQYAARGLTVRGLTVQVLAWQVRSRSAHRLRLRVTDRVVGGVVVGHRGTQSLPVDRPSRRDVLLVRHRGRWVVAAVEGVPPREF